MGALEKLTAICDEIFDRWDKDQRSGKLLSALAGSLTRYRSDVDEVRAALRGAVPIDQWRIVADEDVLIFVVHPNAEFATNPEELARWRGWHIGRWITFNKGGWTYHGMMGTVTHVAPLPAAPEPQNSAPQQRGGPANSPPITKG